MNKKDPNKLKTFGPFEIEGKVANLIKRLQEIVEQHPEATIKYSLDYSGCYYEGDNPTPEFTVRSK